MERREDYRRSERKAIASGLRANTEECVSTHGGKELRREHGRSYQDASLRKGEKLAEKVESDWAKEMRHMFGKIRHRLKRHRDRARSPPRHRRPTYYQVSSSSPSAQTVSHEEAPRSQLTISNSSHTQISSSQSQTSSLTASPSSRTVASSSQGFLQATSPNPSDLRPTVVVASNFSSSKPQAKSLSLQVSSLARSHSSSSFVLSHLVLDSPACKTIDLVASGKGLQGTQLTTMNTELKTAAPSVLESKPEEDTSQPTGALPDSPRDPWKPKMYNSNDSPGLWMAKPVLSPGLLLLSGIHSDNEGLFYRSVDCVGETPMNEIAQHFKNKSIDGVTDMQISHKLVSEKKSLLADEIVLSDGSSQVLTKEKLLETKIDDEVIRDCDGFVTKSANASVAECVVEPPLVVLQVHVPPSVYTAKLLAEPPLCRGDSVSMVGLNKCQMTTSRKSIVTNTDELGRVRAVCESFSKPKKKILSDSSLSDQGFCGQTFLLTVPICAGNEKVVIVN